MQEDTRIDASGKFNLVNEVNDGYLYGGYYKAYGGVKMTEAQIFDAEYTENGTKSAGEYVAEKTTGFWVTDASGAVPYTGSKATAWKKANAYTADKGTAMTPAAGTVYYLKEVPDSYLRPYVQIVYDEYNENKIVKLYKVTAVDDSNYTQAGFYNGASDDSSTTLSATLKIKKGDELITTLTAKGVFDGKTYPDKNTTVPRGYLTAKENSFAASFTMQPYWKTLDGVKVYGVTNRTVDPGNGYFTPDDDGKAVAPGLTISNATNKKAVE
jgi:hypothetical protein